MEIRDMDPRVEFHEGEEAPPPGTRIASIIRWGLLALALLAAGATSMMALGWIGSEARAGVMYHCPMHPTVVSDREADCPICGMDLVPIQGGGEGAHKHDHAHTHAHDEDEELRRVADAIGAKPGQWICPMESCAFVRDHEGTCEVCGMALVQVPEEGAAPRRPVPGMTDVTISPERLARIGVRTSRAERGTLSATVRTVGFVEPAEDRRHRVQARFSGWAERLSVAEVGARVAAGDPLVTIYSPELYQAQLDYLNARQWGGPMRKAARRRLELLGISPREIAAIERRGAPLETLVLRAPADGHVIAKGVTAGARIEPDTVLFEIADLSSVWVHAELFSRDVGRVRAGAHANFRTQDGSVLEGEVALVHPTVDPTTRTTRVRILLPNPELRLRPGMFGDVHLEAETIEGTIVPRDAVIEAGEHDYVLVARGGGRFSPRAVRILGRNSESVAVEGVSPGERVVTSAGFFIDSESRLRSALVNLGGEGQEHPPVSGHAHEGH